MIKWTYVVGISALMLTFTIGFILESKHVHWLPEAAVGVLVGWGVAGLASYLPDVQEKMIYIYISYHLIEIISYLPDVQAKMVYRYPLIDILL